MSHAIYIPPPPPTLTDAMPPLSSSAMQRAAFNAQLRESWFAGFWWGALVFAVLGVWAGWIAAHFAGVAP